MLRKTLILILLAGPAAAQEPAALWPSIQAPEFDAATTAQVRDLKLVRDRIHITLAEGTLQFGKPAAGRVFAAAFRGRGQVSIEPPNALEAHQLRVHIENTSLAMEFTEAIFTFSDKTFDEVAAQVQWTAAADNLARLYIERHDAREDAGAELAPRLFQALLSGDATRSALFAADLRTREKGWIHVRFDAQELEEILAGRWTNWGSGLMRFDTWLSFPAGGRTSIEAAREPLAREAFLIRGYKIDAGVTTGEDLTATARVTLDHIAAGERVLVFLLDARLRVDAVKDAAGRTLTHFQPRDPGRRIQSYGDYVAVVLAEPSAEGQQQTLEFGYSGSRVVRRVGSGNYFCQSFGWYPTRQTASFVTRVDFELSFRFPRRFSLVATGNKMEETTDGNWTVSRWSSGDVPLAVAGFAFGDYRVHSQKVGEIDVEIYANRNPDDFLAGIQVQTSGVMPSRDASASMPIGSLSPSGMVKVMGNEVSNTLKLFESYFGPYPYRRLAVTNIPYSYGQGWPTLIYLSALSFLDSTQRQQFGIAGHVQLTDYFRAHETSHQWWGHRVSWKTYRDQWLSEGFASFSGNLYVQAMRGEGEYLSRLRQDKAQLMTGDLRNRRHESLGPIWMGARLASSDAPGGYATVVYAKGGYVLHMLRMMLFDPRSQTPESRFTTMMRDFTAAFHNRAASTEDFKALVEKHMTPAMDLDGNKRMDWFFNQYVFGIGIPEYTFRYQLEDAGNGRWKVSGVITQRGVGPGWKDILPIYIQQGGRTFRAGWINVRQPETTFNFVLPVRPDKMILNANEDILADVKGN